ncbi:MAG: hypothetical protein JJE53_01560 [Candidatus Pacebacteria bacterium]|nr:hypothetical protein [Candidatus Paceibacterota bacterium]
MKTKFIIFIVVVVLVIGGFGIYVSITPQKPGKLDTFAKCIESSGAKFYGAFWCSHCQNQKELFGSSEKYLPYIECSTLDGQGVNQVCKDNGIEGYPTWVFADESRLSGELSLITLAGKTQCVLPQ